MGEPARNIELTLVIAAEDRFHVVAESRRAFADVHGHVEDAAAHHAQQLGLRHLSLLEVEAAQDAPLRGIRFIVLHERDRSHVRLEVAEGKRFKEITAMVAEDARLDNQRPFDISLDIIHQNSFIIIQR